MVPSITVAALPFHASSIMAVRRFNKQPQKDRVRVNGFIRVPEVRVIGPDNNQLGVMRTKEAMRMARESGLDLVEISPTAKPPVCRITDYGKFKYERDKKQKQAKKKQVVVKLKEIKYHANVEEHDYQTKLRHARDFLEHGNRVKCSLFFRGRENTHHEIGFQLFERIIGDLEDQAQVDQAPKLAGRSLIMMLSPVKN